MSEAPNPDAIFEACSACGLDLDVSQFEPFASVECPCGQETRVKRMFGNYRLERRYAVGGMSVVFVAWDTTLDREVAVKILNEEYSVDGGRVEQFENEARLTAAVHNPHVVQIYTVGKAYGRFYLVMELLEGRSFDLVMSERGAIPEAEVLGIGRQVLDGLSAANEAGVIHRDVKPGNVLIDSTGQVKLVDFGLALITKGGKVQAEEIWATPYYVPPEVLDRGVEDFRSDLYALGSTLYHALTGKPPFEATSTQTKFLKEKKKVIPKLQKAASWLKPSTCEAIDRMMAYEPKNRASSYREALAMIELAQAEVSDSGLTPIHGQSRAKRRSRRKAVGFMQAGAGLLALGGMTFIGMKLFGEKPAEQEPEPVTNVVPGVITPTTSGGGSNQLSQGKTEFLARAWAQGREAVSKRDFRLAATQFAKISRDSTVPEPTRSWAELEGILSKLFAGMSGKARDDARSMRRRLQKAKQLDPVTSGLSQVAQQLSQERPVSPAQFSAQPANIVEWISSLALTMKNWEQGQLQECRPRLEQIKSADLGGDYEWFSVYRNVITDYLYDAAILADLPSLPMPGTEAEAHAQLNDFNERFAKLKTGGRAKFNVRTRQAYLARLRKGFQLRPGDASATPWVKVKEQLLELFRERKFEEARALLSENEKSGPEVARWAYDYLAQKAYTFMVDLDGQKKLRIQYADNGAEVNIVSISTGHLTIEGGKELPWSNFDTSTLIKVHDQVRANLSAEQSQTMQIHGIAYAWLSGLKALAEFEAEKLAEENAEFAKNWKRVMIGTSE